ncbi:hypothetical protein BD626DRAFT_502129 [Schizophyllum amplum]|uniref:Uncharacterized protein n=1 Tax=Schizophyllum amplum TaxID=97359 RepID=A0A550C939_9AGAR|nr:hypothetical protein BD626DRAFT_502129 [Auriculariopsis ampla]
MFTELMMRSAHGAADFMRGPTDQVLPPRTKQVVLHISWPGLPKDFSHYQKSIPAIINGKPMSRAQLGHQVVLAYYEFFGSVRQYNESREKKLKDEDPTKMVFDKLVLLSVCNLGGENWQAEIARLKK